MSATPPTPILLPLRDRKGQVVAHALIDPEDQQAVAPHRWHRVVGEWHTYAAATVSDRRVFLHRLLLGLGRGDPRYGDHVNGDGLDCRRSNLRVLTAAGNAQNRAGATKASKTGVRGVSLHRPSGLYRAVCQVNGRQHSAGYHRTIEQAAEAVRLLRAEHMPYVR